MEKVQISKNEWVTATTHSNRMGFVHQAAYLRNNNVIKRASIQYYNRTWERFAYQSVLNKLADKVPTLSQNEIFNDLLENGFCCIKDYEERQKLKSN